MSIDRLPPQSIDAEQSVLGALLIDRDAVIEVADLLRPADFYRGHHGTIYGAILDLYERREPIDIVTVSEVLERDGEPRAGRRRSLSDQPHQPHAHRGQRRLLRPHRRTQGRAAEPHRGRGAHRRHRLRGRPGRGRGHRPRRAGAVRRQSEAGGDAASVRCARCSTRRTTGSTTCTSTRARSAAYAPASATWTRSPPDSRSRTS